MNTKTKAQTPSAPADKSAHTPGPWSVAHSISDDSRPYVHLKTGNYGTSVHECVIECPEYTLATTGDTDRETAIANARLIAAAPDLLQACKMVQKLVNQMAFGGGVVEELDPFGNGIKQIDAAIAKAEGK